MTKSATNLNIRSALFFGEPVSKRPLSSVEVVIWYWCTKPLRGSFSFTYGIPVNPVLRLGDYRLVPDELKLIHIEDFRDDAQYESNLKKLVRQLSDPVAPIGKLVGVPGLPRHLIKRSELLEPLKNTVLSDIRRPVIVTGASSKIGVYGMGGIGKSVFANMLARDPGVRRTFFDGVIWVPFGKDPNLVELQRNVAEVFNDEQGYVENVYQGRSKLAIILETKTVIVAR